uniref:Integrase, catalytic region, zinc finger, CCHC-type, peptidase aspartic, catalytic n=1 Tax=Tanacetum cinerariifolium TaxID=118510 RepID=A0A699GJC6_TANCI|nr:hypothetical protein [Tanacetum cinerariifolium]
MMANLSEDIQSVGFDTRPLMLDWSDFESWQQCIHLYYLGKENGDNILQSINEGPFKMGKFGETLADGALGPERDRVVKDLTPKEKERYKADIRSELTKDERESQLYDAFEHFCQNKGETIHEYYVRGLKTSNYDQLYAYLKQHEAHANENKMMSERYTQHSSEYFKDKMLLMQAQENRVVLDEEQLLFITDHIFQADQCDAFNSDVDEAPTAQTMFMADLSSADPIYNEAGPSYDSDIISEVQDHNDYIDNVGEYHEHVKNNVEQVVQSNVSFVPNDVLMMIINDMHKLAVQCISAIEQNKVVNESLTAKLARYKEQVEIYEKGQFKTNRAPAVVHESEDTLESAEITRKKMLEKMKSPLYIEKKIKIAPLDYSKENYHATFTPPRQLSAEQIFWPSVLKPILEMTVFFEMHDAYTVEQARNIELEAEISKLKHKIQKDDNSEMIKHFSNLAVNHLNLQLKYQYLKERFRNNKSQTSQDVPEFDSFFEINKLKEQIQGKNNTIRNLKVKISQINEKRREPDRILDFKALDSLNIELTEHVTVLQEQNERFRVENETVKKDYKELYDSIKIMRAKTIEKTSSLLNENEKLKARLKEKIKSVTMNTVKPKFLTPGMYAIDVEPILPQNRNNKEVHLDYLKHLKESVKTLRDIVEEARIEKPLDNALESACFYTKRS